MHTLPSQPLRINPSLPVDRDDALRLALSHVPTADRQRHLAAWQQAAEPGRVTVWTARQSEHLAAALIVEVLPGRVATILPPHSAPGEPLESAMELLAGVINHLRDQGVRLAQVLLPGPSEKRDRDILESCGFCAAGELLYLVNLIRPHEPGLAPDERLEWLSYSETPHAHFAHVIEQTYADSLDSPGWRDGRSIDDVLETYRATGDFNPRHWLLVRHAGADVGCLILADQARENTCELVYLGLIPGARGKGLGAALVRQAQQIARQCGRARLTTAVDAVNTPAVALYVAEDFVEWARRVVYLRAIC